MVPIVPIFFLTNKPFFHTCFRGVDCVTDSDCEYSWFITHPQDICCDGKCRAVCATLVNKFQFKKYCVLQKILNTGDLFGFVYRKFSSKLSKVDS